MMGQVGTERDGNWVYVAVVFALVFVWSRTKDRELDTLLVGEATAKSLGTDVDRLGLQVILAVSALVAASVSVSGLIGFVGLLAPHFSKFLFRTHRHRLFLVGSAGAGGWLLLTADILARLLGGDRELPTGGLVALFGAPMLIYLIYRGAHEN
jgi:iron complex transport system permease protein